MTLVIPQCLSHAPLRQMGRAAGLVRDQPGILLLLAALVVGQLLKALTQPRLPDSPLVGQIPLLPAVTLAASLVLALFIVYLRLRLGQQLVTAARARAIALPDPASLPKRYAIPDPASQLTSAALCLVDLALLLLVQATLRPPVLALAERFLIPRTRAEGVFVGIVVLLALLLLIRLWRVGGPVLVLLLWWALDRVVPTAGFLGARAELATSPTTVGRPVTPPASTPSLGEPTVAAERTVAAQRSAADVPTVASARRSESEATVLAEATVVSSVNDDESTVLKPESA